MILKKIMLQNYFIKYNISVHKDTAFNQIPIESTFYFLREGVTFVNAQCLEN